MKNIFHEAIGSVNRTNPIGSKRQNEPTLLVRRTHPVASFFVILLFALMGSATFGQEKSFSIPQPNYEFQFPRDHGSHPDFKIEWWYITGHLKSESERRFGFQATFFRLANVDAEAHIYMAHMAVSDPDTGTFLHEERLNREGWDAFSKVEDLDLRNGNWTLKRQFDGEMDLIGSVQSKAGFSLKLSPAQSHVIFGKDGISKKGADASAASYYITYPRLDVSGELQFKGEKMAVTGEAWMDHEISSSQLDRNQVGWDWIQIQFDDGRELMGYILREEDGKPSPFSSLNWIDQDGSITVQKPDSYEWKAGGFWKSKATGANYPTSPTIKTTDPKTGKPIVLKSRPTIKNQEMTGKIGGVSYWEGAGDVLDGSGKVIGKSFLELTGYVGDLGEKLR